VISVIIEQEHTLNHQQELSSISIAPIVRQLLEIISHVSSFSLKLMHTGMQARIFTL